MRIGIKEPNKKTRFINIEDGMLLSDIFSKYCKDYDGRYISSYLSYSYYNDIHIDIYLYDIFTDLEPNFFVMANKKITPLELIRGSVIFMGWDGGEGNISLNKSQINYIKKHFDKGYF